MVNEGVTETEFYIDEESTQNNKSVTHYPNSSSSRDTTSCSRKFPLTQHNDLYKEIKRNCQKSRNNSLNTPGSSEQSSELGTSCELEERSSSTQTNEVHIFLNLSYGQIQAFQILSK